MHWRKFARPFARRRMIYKIKRDADTSFGERFQRMVSAIEVVEHMWTDFIRSIRKPQEL